MIITVTLNTAVDKTYTIPNFSLDRVHRPTQWRIVPGGKGINVSRVLKELGLESIAMGFAGGYNGKFVRAGLESEGITSDLVDTTNESRVCITVIDPEHGTQTEINENGPEIGIAELTELGNRIIARLPKAEALVLSGSIPPGVPDDIYARWIRAAKERGVFTVLDSSGKSLIEGLKADPDIVKPNSKELSDLTGRELYTTPEILQAAKEIVGHGVGRVFISMGRTGAIATDGKNSFSAAPPEIEFVSAVGSGDAFVAGLLFARHHEYTLQDSIRLAVAAGAANATSFGAGFCSRDSILSLYHQVAVSEIKEDPEVL